MFRDSFYANVYDDYYLYQDGQKPGKFRLWKIRPEINFISQKEDMSATKAMYGKYEFYFSLREW